MEKYRLRKTREKEKIGETGMVDNFDVSLSSSFIRKKKYSKKESVGFIYTLGFYIHTLFLAVFSS